MKKDISPAELPKHEPQPGASVTLETQRDGSVQVDFSDGSTPLNVSRRDFLRIGGVAAASAAMAGAACRNPVEKIVPYVDRPEEVRIGTPNYYATVCRACPSQCGTLVQTRAGRPVKLEGNPKHPVSRGAMCAMGQASYLNLYDPSRARTPLKVSRDNDQHQVVTWENLDRAVVSKLGQLQAGGRVAILTDSTTGSAQNALIGEILSAVPGSKHYTYEALTSEALLEANELCYGVRGIPHFRFDKANLIVSFNSDFLGTWLSPTEFTKQFSSRRNPEEGMNRLVAFEGAATLTGFNADDRYRVRISDLVYVALALTHEVAVTLKKGPLAGNPGLSQRLAAFAPKRVAEQTGIDEAIITRLGADLAANVGASLAVAGGVASSTETGIALETAINLLNAAVGADGKTIERSLVSRQSQGQLSDLSDLVKDIDSGRIDVLLVAGTNPIYSAPPELNLAAALEKVPFVVSMSDRVDETAFFADYLANGCHYLEAWGDSVPFEGVYALQQPAIRPIFDARPFEDSLLTWFGQSGLVTRFKTFLESTEAPPGNHPGNRSFETGPWYRYLRDHWNSQIYPKANAFAGFEAYWEDVLRQGVWVSPDAVTPASNLRLNAALTRIPQDLPKPKEASKGLSGTKELHMFASIPMYDGRHANNGHLQELPDPLTKIAWGSYIMVSPRTLTESGLSLGDIVRVKPTGSDRVLEFPVVMQPGLHDDVVAIPLGYGRERTGVVGSGIGQNGFLFSKVGQDGLQILSGIEVELSRTGSKERVALMQDGALIDLHKRAIMGTATYEAFKQDPAAGIHHHHDYEDLWKNHDYKVKWGMTIDMTKCTGCNACVIACQEENNIPVVGKAGVIEGREMHWLRIDRYYKLPEDTELERMRHSATDDPMFDRRPEERLASYLENPRVLMQPMLCQHCENAPCETVCPVLATVHSSDGLNQMAYNRCVGTRYCANNCPYKVRRFNWYNYSADRSDSFFATLFPEMKDHARLNVVDPLPMHLNPEVTVRSRGVMEKCTFCVQRIRRAGWEIKKKNRSQFREGDVVTACQQTCPADAIRFGDLVDRDSAVAKDRVSARAVQALAELGTIPSVTYLSSIWNTVEEDV